METAPVFLSAVKSANLALWSRTAPLNTQNGTEQNGDAHESSWNLMEPHGAFMDCSWSLMVDLSWCFLAPLRPALVMSEPAPSSPTPPPSRLAKRHMKPISYLLDGLTVRARKLRRKRSGAAGSGSGGPMYFPPPWQGCSASRRPGVVLYCLRRSGRLWSRPGR